MGGTLEINVHGNNNEASAIFTRVSAAFILYFFYNKNSKNGLGLPLAVDA